MLVVEGVLEQVQAGLDGLLDPFHDPAAWVGPGPTLGERDSYLLAVRKAGFRDSLDTSSLQDRAIMPEHKVTDLGTASVQHFLPVKYLGWRCRGGMEPAPLSGLAPLPENTLQTGQRPEANHQSKGGSVTRQACSILSSSQSNGVEPKFQ